MWFLPSGRWPDPRSQYATISQVPPSSGAVQDTRPPTTCAARSVTVAWSRRTGSAVGELPADTRTAWTRKSRWSVTPGSGSSAAGSGPSYVDPAATVVNPWASSFAAAGLSGVMEGTAAGQAGPMVRSTRTSRFLASRRAASMAARQAVVPQP